MAWNISYIAKEFSKIVNGGGSVKVVDILDVALHAGELFRCGAQKDVTSGGTFNFVIKIPVGIENMHFFPSIDSEDQIEIIFYEAPTNDPTGGTTVTPRSANRNFPDNSASTVVYDATVDLTGATILGKSVVGERNSSGSIDSVAPFILKPDTYYIQVITNKSTGNNEVTIANWAYTH